MAEEVAVVLALSEDARERLRQCPGPGWDVLKSGRTEPRAYGPAWRRPWIPASEAAILGAACEVAKTLPEWPFAGWTLHDTTGGVVARVWRGIHGQPFEATAPTARHAALLVYAAVNAEGGSRG